MSRIEATALIAEDEPLLARALAAALADAWPGLRILDSVGDGLRAQARALELLPDLLLFDIRMPGQDGLAAAAALAEAWPAQRPFPALVFVTAYDQYAVRAFEAQAVDYVLKPVQPQRLRRTVERVQAQLARRPLAPDAGLEQLRRLLEVLPGGNAPAPAPPAEPLRFLPASEGAGGRAGTVRMVPVAEVLVLDAADKYLRVVTAGREYLLRTPLRDLVPQLPPGLFWQVHRGTLVRADAVERVDRDEAGRLQLRMRGLAERWTVSRLYAARFRAL